LPACLPASVFFACALLAASLLHTLIVFREGDRSVCICGAFLSLEIFFVAVVKDSVVVVVVVVASVRSLRVA
jgi:hypothetical protein